MSEAAYNPAWRGRWGALRTGVAWGALGYVAMRGGACVMSYAVSLLLANWLGPAGLGAYAVGLTTLTLGAVVACLGTDTAAVAWLAQSGRGWRRWRGALRACGALAALLGALVAAAGIYLLNNPAIWLAVGLALPLAAAARLQVAALRGAGRTGRANALQELTPAAANLAMVLAAGWFWGRGSMMPAAVLLGSAALQAAVGAKLLRDRAPVGRSRPRLGRAGLWASAPMLASSLVVVGMESIDLWMLAAMHGQSAAGVYRVAARLAVVVMLPLVAVTSVAMPRFASMWQNDRAQLPGFAQRCAGLALLAGAPAAVVMLSFAEPLVALFGEGFTGAAWPLRVLAVAQLLNVAAGLTGPLLNMTGRAVALRNALGLGLASNVIFNALLIPRFGVMGAAAATGASIVLVNATAVVAVRRSLGFWPTGALAAGRAQGVNT